MRNSLWRMNIRRLLRLGDAAGRRQLRSGLRVVELESRLVPAAPVSLSINRLAAPNTNAVSVDYAVQFDQAVTGVDAADFKVATTSSLVAGGALSVAGSGAHYTVSLHGLRGSGDLRLDLIDDDTIVAGDLALGGPGLANGSFQGQTYHVLQTLPSVTSINRATPAAELTNASTVTFQVTFRTAVSGVDAADFALVSSAGGAISQVAPAGGSTFDVTVSGMSGSGSIGLNLVDNGSIRDAAGNPLVGVNAPAVFQGQQTWGAGLIPYAVAAGDLNADGKQDLAVANGGAESVSVLLGNGDGTFGPQATFAAGVNPYSIASGDVSGDGKPDLAVANYGSDSVSVLIGQGDGTFLPQQTYATGRMPYSVAIGDVSGDGKPDLIVANSSSDTVSVLLNRGDGTFADQQTSPAGAAPVAAALDDFDDDGHADLVAVNAGAGSVSVLLGVGDGTFEPQQTFAAGEVPVSLSGGDVNGDGQPDLAIANFFNDAISVLLGNGDGTFQRNQTFAAGIGPVATALGDLNGDGQIDLAVANFNGHSVGTRLGLGNGGFAEQHTETTGKNPHSVALGDFNGDGRTDFAVANFTDANAGTFLNLLSGTFTGQSYTIDQTAPTAAIVPVDPDPRSSAIGQVAIHFSEPVQNVDIADFVLTRQGFPTGLSASALSGSGGAYLLDLAAVTSSGGVPILGTYVLTVSPSNITDATGNPLAGAASDSWRIVSGVATATSLTATPNASTGGQLVTFTATVAPSPGAAGTVTFKDAGATLPGGASVALVDGVATLQISTLAAGTHPITADYSGAAGFFGSTSNTIDYNVSAPPPTVVSVTVNGNIGGFAGVQRSRVASLVVVFDQAVQLDADAMALALHTNEVTFGGVPQPAGVGGLPNSLVATSTDNITWTVTFSGNTEGGADGFPSLKDGVYDFTIDAAKVHPSGVPSVSMAFNSTTTFFRLFGDTNAPTTPIGGTPGLDFQAIVNTGDNLTFRGAFNNAATYKAFVDFNGDGLINTGDNLQFRNRFNKALTWRS